MDNYQQNFLTCLLPHFSQPLLTYLKVQGEEKHFQIVQLRKNPHNKLLFFKNFFQIEKTKSNLKICLPTSTNNNNSSHSLKKRKHKTNNSLQKLLDHFLKYNKRFKIMSIMLINLQCERGDVEEIQRRTVQMKNITKA